MNITLIGMMGSGKTTIGIELEKVLKTFSLVDIDSQIVEKQGLSIPAIFENFGEQFFREKETEEIEEILKKDNQIISTGGGAFENKKNRNLLLENSKVIYLKASPKVIYDRIKTETHRPLLGKDFSIDKIASIIAKRQANYEKAHVTIDTDFKSPYNIVTEILEWLNFV